MNEGKSTPISIRVTGKDQKTAHRIATLIRNEVTKIDGVVDARIIQRLDYPAVSSSRSIGPRRPSSG